MENLAVLHSFKPSSVDLVPGKVEIPILMKLIINGVIAKKNLPKRR